METFKEWAAHEREINKAKLELRAKRKGIQLKEEQNIFHDKAEGKFFLSDSSLYCCYYCGCRGEKCTRDHFWPRSLGGILMVYAYKVCQVTKANKLPEEWIESLNETNRFSQIYKDDVRSKVQKLWNIINAHKIQYKRAVWIKK